MAEKNSKEKPDLLEIAGQINKGDTVVYDQGKKEKNKPKPTLWEKVKECLVSKS